MLLRWIACAFVMSAVLAWGTGDASAQLVKRSSAPEKVKLPLAAQFADLVGKALDQTFAPGELREGLPAAFVGLIEANYEGKARENILDRYRGYTSAFEQRWQAYEGRKAEVAAAVTSAKGLAASKQFNKARAQLESVITPVPLDDATGSISAKRDQLEAMDAELPALAALALLTTKLKEPYLLADICVAYGARRRVLDKDSERLMWMAAQEPGRFGGYGAGLKNYASRAVKLVVDAAYQVRHSDGAMLASGLFWSMASYGVTSVSPFARKGAKKGKWAMFELIPYPGVTIKVGKQQVKFDADMTLNVPFNCKQSDKVEGFNPVTNKFVYGETCQHRQERVKASLAATLNAPAPAWAQKPGERLWVIGKVKKLGPKWVITDAQVVDFRFLGAMTNINAGPGASSLF